MLSFNLSLHNPFADLFTPLLPWKTFSKKSTYGWTVIADVSKPNLLNLLLLNFSITRGSKWTNPLKRSPWVAFTFSFVICGVGIHLYSQYAFRPPFEFKGEYGEDL